MSFVPIEGVDYPEPVEEVYCRVKVIDLWNLVDELKCASVPMVAWDPEPLQMAADAVRLMSASIMSARETVGRMAGFNSASEAVEHWERYGS